MQKMWSKSTFRVRYLQSFLFDLEMTNLPMRESVRVQVRVGVPVYAGTQQEGGSMEASPTCQLLATVEADSKYALIRPQKLLPSFP